MPAAECRRTAAARLPRIAAAILVLLFLFSAAARAQAPQQVEVGIQVQSLRNLAIAAGSFEATMLVWTRSPTADFDPLERLLLVQGRVLRSRILSRLRTTDGQHLVAALLEASFDQRLDPSDYPFDRHGLAIAVQAMEPSAQTRLVAHAGHSGLAPDFFGIGWRAGTPRLAMSEHLAPTSFGTADEAYRHYSRATLTLPVWREAGLIGLGNFAGFAVAVAIALAAFWIPAGHLGIRVSLVGSAVVAGIGNRYLLNDRIGIGPASALSETVSTIAFLCAGLALVCAVAGERNRGAGRARHARIIDRGGLALCAALASIAIARVLWAALSG